MIENSTKAIKMVKTSKLFYLLWLGNRILYGGMVYMDYRCVKGAINTVPTSCVRFGEIGMPVFVYILLTTPFLCGDALYFVLGFPFFFLGMDPPAIVYNFVGFVLLMAVSIVIKIPLNSLCGNASDLFNALPMNAFITAGLHLLTGVLYQCFTPDSVAKPDGRVRKKRK